MSEAKGLEIYMQKNYEIQRIRAIALICILIGHMPFNTSKYVIHGYTFVTLFLIITGYFSTISLINKYDNSISRLKVIKSELINRVLRLFPLMWIWILIYFFIGWIFIFQGGQYGDWGRWKNELIHAFNLTYNYYLAKLDIGGLFGQYWTLFVEIHFAIIFIILYGIIRNSKTRKIIAVSFVLLTVFIFRPLTPTREVRYVTHAHFDALFCGVLIALYDKKKIINFDISERIKPIISIILCIVMLLSGYFFDTYYNNMNIKYVFYSLLGCVIFLMAKDNDGWFNFGKIINKFLDFVGDTSASTYVSHIIIYSCVYYNLYYNTNLIPVVIQSTFWGIILQILFLELFAFGVGWISMQIIEKPFGLLAKKTHNKSK